MLALLRMSGWKKLVAALYAVAMLTLGFAHHQTRIAANPAVDASATHLLAFALPDGTLPEICGNSKNGAPDSHHGLLICDACQLTAAPGAIPAPPTLIEAPRLAMKLPPVRAIVSIAAAPALEAQSRGPPLLS
jgi:hypothetical protein